MAGDDVPETVSVNQVTGRPAVSEKTPTFSDSPRPAARVVEGWVAHHDNERQQPLAGTFSRDREQTKDIISRAFMLSWAELMAHGWYLAPATLTIHHQEGE